MREQSIVVNVLGGTIGFKLPWKCVLKRVIMQPVNSISETIGYVWGSPSQNLNQLEVVGGGSSVQTGPIAICSSPIGNDGTNNIAMSNGEAEVSIPLEKGTVLTSTQEAGTINRWILYFQLS